MTARYLPLQILLLMFAGWVSREQQRTIEYLVEENRVLKEQLKRLTWGYTRIQGELKDVGRRVGRSTIARTPITDRHVTRPQCLTRPGRLNWVRHHAPLREPPAGFTLQSITSKRQLRQLGRELLGACIFTRGSGDEVIERAPDLRGFFKDRSQLGVRLEARERARSFCGDETHGLRQIEDSTLDVRSR